jgi:beta-lactamase regulating signal transducer with metallopeptidase domain
MTDALQLLAPALADVLVRFVWQGAAIGVLAWTALALLRDARPQARYAVACLALLSCVVVPVGGLMQALVAFDPAAPGDIAPSLPFVAAMVDAGRDARTFALPEPATPWIVIAWGAGVLVLSLRMACGLLWASRLRCAGDDDAGGPWQQRVDRLARRLGIARPVALRLVPGEGSPLTAGWLRPVVLLPVAVATRMPVDLVEALLAHELAHVRRHDYLVNVLQGAAEALLFYHPAVWWLSHRIRVERELVADDLAAGALGDRRRLALALSELERFVPERPEAFPAHLAPAAHGGQLMSRIQQLIRPQRRSAGALIALPLVGIALAGAAFYAQARLAAQHDLAAPAPAATPVPANAAAPAAAPTPRATPAPLPAPVAAPAAGVLPTPGRDDDSSYAFVRKGEDGIAMSGDMDDRRAIEAARARIDGDFLWFRRDGKAWVVRDAATIASARQAWAGVEGIEKEMQALQAKMTPHSERMEALSQRMQALHVDNAFDSAEGRETQAGMQALAREMETLAGERMRLARRERRADSDSERAELDRAMAALDQRQATLDAAMEKYDATMEQFSKRMQAQQVPMEALSREMEAASKPMDAIGRDMGAVGQRIERAAKVADRQVRSLIDQAWRDGRAQPAPALR